MVPTPKRQRGMLLLGLEDVISNTASRLQLSVFGLLFNTCLAGARVTDRLFVGKKLRVFPRARSTLVVLDIREAPPTNKWGPVPRETGLVCSLARPEQVSNYEFVGPPGWERHPQSGYVIFILVGSNECIRGQLIKVAMDDSS